MTGTPGRDVAGTPTTAVGYVRVSTEDQGVSGASLAAQRDQIAGEVARRDSWVLEYASEVASAGTVRKRPVLTEVLGRLDRGELDVLVVARLDRLSRSVGDFALLMERAAKHDWQIVCLDPPVDMSSPFGEAMALSAAVWAQLERRLISQRTKRAIDARKLAGTYRGGRVGNPPQVPVEVAARIVELRRGGGSERGIAARLTLEGVRAPRGGAWSSSTVRRTLRRAGVS